ncbi:TlpA family protein disulfide reductase [Luteolibacter ambystomatis]|uniref:TlpA family protein disulfide reductase n=1 Tax=Luteolibacter ambystomatis TaxID=2824561 RepID=A0A975IZW7_9BACT|nr:TlpA disulfide reductase family protein [Luteolibacter ambystomatis]QUE50535.1 TlpA family protein disulfide reductase [Luteolibacter ambystomatis]
MKKALFVCALLALPGLGLAKDKKEETAVPSASVDQVRWGTPANEAAFDKDQLKGKVVVVEQWGVHCAPCIASLPNLAKMAKTYEKSGLVIVGLESQNGSKEEITKLINDARVKYPIQSGGSVPVSSSGIPHALVFGADGKLTWHGNPHDEDFEKEVKKALREAKAGAKTESKL